MTHALAAAAPATAPAVDGLPLTVALAGREVLVVGAGPVSARRARAFVENTDNSKFEEYHYKVFYF